MKKGCLCKAVRLINLEFAALPNRVPNPSELYFGLLERSLLKESRIVSSSHRSDCMLQLLSLVSHFAKFAVPCLRRADAKDTLKLCRNCFSKTLFKSQAPRHQQDCQWGIANRAHKRRTALPLSCALCRSVCSGAYR